MDETRLRAVIREEIALASDYSIAERLDRIIAAREAGE